MMTEYDTNQTQFAETQPLFQGVSTPTIEKTPQESNSSSVQNTSKKKKLVVIAAVGCGFLFLLLILLALVPKKPPELAQVEASPLPSPVISRDNPLRARVENLQAELDAADPKNQLFVFPPVSMEIFLDKIQN